VPEPIIASTRYGDFKGTVSISGDGCSLPLDRFLRQKIDLPDGYTLVGFEFAILANGPPKWGHSCDLALYATNVAKAGQELSDYARNHVDVPVEKFRAEVELQPADLLKLVELTKEFSLVAASNSIEGKPMVLVETE